MRLFISFVWFGVLLCSHCVVQFVAAPAYSFEKLTWGDSLELVKQKLAGKTLTGRDTINDATRNRMGLQSYSYNDTVDSKEVAISLGFSDAGRHLSIITLFYFGTPKRQARTDTVVTGNAEELWQWFTTRYGPMHIDKDLSLLGQARLWRFWKTSVQMTMRHGDTDLLTVIYRQEEVN